MEMAECSLNGLKTLCEKEEYARHEQFLLFTQCFNRLVLQTCENQGLFGKGLTEQP